MAVMRLEVVGAEDIIGGHLRAATDSETSNFTNLLDLKEMTKNIEYTKHEPALRKFLLGLRRG
jgi:hypothetical protein